MSTQTLEQLIRTHTTNESDPRTSVWTGSFVHAGTQYILRHAVISIETLISTGTGYGTVTDATERDFAMSLRSIQEHSGLNWGEIARALGVSRRTVHNWLIGTKVNGINARRVAGLYRGILQELVGVSRESARTHLLAPDANGTTALARITKDVRGKYGTKAPTISGVDLLRTPESADETMTTGGLDPEMPVLGFSDGTD